MSRKWIAIWIMLAGLVILALPAAVPAQAQDPTPENDDNCVSCHETQYFLYDSGKYFCLCEAPMHCVYCHGGRIDSYTKEIAHEGMTFYPTADQAARCKTCHTEDYMARVVKFDAAAGIRPEPRPMVTATPVAIAAAPVGPPPGGVFLTLNQLEPWRLAGLGFLALAMVGIVFAGYRCWKADCIAKLQPKPNH
jgi:hypothetical protein